MSRLFSLPFECPCKTKFPVHFKKPSPGNPSITRGTCPQCGSEWQIRYNKVPGETAVTCEFKQINFTDHGQKRMTKPWTRIADSVKGFFK